MLIFAFKHEVSFKAICYELLKRTTVADQINLQLQKQVVEYKTKYTQNISSICVKDI